MTTERFRDTADFLPTWNCKYTGSTKGGDLQKLEATDKSWIIGWYVGTRDGDINGDPVKIHTVRVVECGDPTHLSAPIDDPVAGTDFEFVGDFVINDRLATKIQPGQSCKIQWMGKTNPKKEGGRPYHLWKLYEDTVTEPIVIQNGMVVEDGGSSSHEIEGIAQDSEAPVTDALPQGGQPTPLPAQEAAPAQETASAGPEDDDDLPF